VLLKYCFLLGGFACKLIKSDCAIVDLCSIKKYIDEAFTVYDRTKGVLLGALLYLCTFFTSADKVAFIFVLC